MASIEHSKSLFSQKLDRIAFVSYFLGAVVPLVAVAVIVQQFVMPTLDETRLAIGIVAAVSCKLPSLGTFPAAAGAKTAAPQLIELRAPAKFSETAGESTRFG